MSVELGRATVRSRSLSAARFYGIASAFAAAAAALAAVASGPWLAGGLAVLGAFFGARALDGGKWGKPTAGALRTAGGTLTLDGTTLVRGGRVEYALPLGGGAVVGTALGQEHVVVVHGPSRDRLLDALRESDDAVTIRWRRHLRPLLWFLGATAAVLFAGGVATGTLLDVPVLGGAVATLLVMFAVWLAPRTDSLSIGKDGIAIRKAVERVVPLAEIEDVSVAAPAGAGRALGPVLLILGLKNGTRVRIEVSDGDATLLEGVQLEIERRCAEASRGGSGRSVVERLVRDGRSMEEWVAALGTLLRGGGGFRDVAVSEDDVLAVLEDVSVPAEARIGAALALAGQGEEHADIVRDIAADVASPRLRVALDEALQGNASDELVEAAVLEEENAVGRVR